MGVVPIRLDENTLKKIDLLVKAHVFKNRSDAIRRILNRLLAHEPLHALLDKLNFSRIAEALSLLKKIGGVKFVSNEPAYRIVRGERA